MGKNIYVDGGLIATTGNLYTRTIFAKATCYPDDSEKVIPEGGRLEITTNTGSIFDTYYVKSYVNACGGTVGAIKAFRDIYQFTISKYEKGAELVKEMLDDIPSGEHENLYCQQQYASVFSLMEQFLSCTFVRQTCDREDSYHQVLESGLLQQKFGYKDILNGPDCLDKELLYINLSNKVVYHNKNAVKLLFDAAFGIDVDLTPLEREMEIRNDIIHRFGYTTSGVKVDVRKKSVIDLITSVDLIVQNTAKQILAMNNGQGSIAAQS